MKLERILEIVERVYSEDHMLIFNTNGISGIEDCSGKIAEIDFGSLEELYKWCKEKEDE